MMPKVNQSILLSNRPGLKSRLLGYTSVGVRDLDAFTTLIEQPMVEGASNAGTLDNSAGSEMSPEMGTVTVFDLKHALIVPKGDERLVEILQLLDISPLIFIREANNKPAFGIAIKPR